MPHSSWMQNVVINVCEKFHYDRLRNDRALGNGKPDNNNDNNKNNVRSLWGIRSGSKKIKLTLVFPFYRKLYRVGQKSEPQMFYT